MRRLAVVAAILVAAALLVIGGVAPTPLAAREDQAQPAVGAGGPVDPRMLDSLAWRNIGPNRGGRSIAVAGSAARPLEYYFGATGGGLWKTSDGGLTWRPTTDGQIGTSSVGAVAVAESNPDIVYLGTGETQLRGNVIQGDGLYRSSDGGKTWTRAGLADSQAIARIRVHPTNPDLVYVAALGHVYGPNAERGIFRSNDGGKRWERILFRDDRSGGVDLCLDPANPQVLYAALWEVFRTPHSLSSGGPGSGLFKSTDGGATWAELTRHAGMPDGVIGKIGVAVSGADSQRVYAIVEAHEGGIFRSDDGGATWSKVNDDRRFRQRAFYYTRIYADPKSRDTLYVLNTGLYRSTDAGKSWTAIRVPHGDNHDLWVAPNDPSRLINANDGGANVSINGGQSWTGQSYPTAQMYHVITTPHVPYHVCGAQQDNSTACVSSADDGSTWYQVGGGESGYIAVDPRDGNVFYAGSYGGLLTRLDRATGQSRQITVWPENPMGHSSSDIRERFQWTFPIVVSPHDPREVLAASQHLWRTVDAGQRWERISPDLTRADPATMGPSGGPITLDQTGVETYATIFTVAPSRVDRGTIWTGSDDGVVSLTRDGGQSWHTVTPAGLPAFSRISLIEASPHAPGTAYLAANRYQRDDRAPYFFRTDDYGRTWTAIVSGLGDGDLGRAIREDPKRPGLLYAGTERGIFVSFDRGAHWQPLSRNLPVTPVHDIVVEEHDLVIATHGRSFWVLDNIAVLRQVTPATASASVHLFTPPDPMRGVTRGLSIDYHLGQAAERVVVEILDDRGGVVRRFGADADDRPAQTPGASSEAGAGPPAPRPGRRAGMNRFTWDLRYPGPVEFPGMILWAASARGPLAPPGPYRVRLTVGDVVEERPFTMQRHRLLTEVSDADLQAQFTLAMNVRDRVSQANGAVVRIRDLKAQIAERLGRPEAATRRPLAGSGEALTTRLTEVEGEIYQYRNQSSQDPLNYPIKLNNKLAALQGVIESAQARPTDQSVTVFTELSARLDEQLKRLDALVATDLTAFNKLLAGARLAPVK